MSKISAKFDRGRPLWGRQMQVGWVKIGDFRQIAGYISITVQDRHMVSISDVNKDLTFKAKDKDQAYKDQDKDQTPKDKDQTFKDKDQDKD